MSYNQQLDVIFDGLAIVDDGMISSYNTLSGTGLNTFGFLWDAANIWQKSDTVITTVWTVENPQ